MAAGGNQGSGGSPYNAGSKSFPAVPYDPTRKVSSGRSSLYWTDLLKISEIRCAKLEVEALKTTMIPIK